MPVPDFTTLPPVMKPPAEISTSPAPVMSIWDWPERRPPDRRILPVDAVIVSASLK